jgi:hypothetical protein
MLKQVGCIERWVFPTSSRGSLGDWKCIDSSMVECDGAFLQTLNANVTILDWEYFTLFPCYLLTLPQPGCTVYCWDCRFLAVKAARALLLYNEHTCVYLTLRIRVSRE